jgi:hypothetical protein
MIQQTPLLGIYPKEMKAFIQRDICTGSTIHNSQEIKIA